MRTRLCAQVASLGNAHLWAHSTVSPALYTAMSDTAKHDWAWHCAWILKAPEYNLTVKYSYPIGAESSGHRKLAEVGSKTQV